MKVGGIIRTQGIGSGSKRTGYTNIRQCVELFSSLIALNSRISSNDRQSQGRTSEEDTADPQREPWATNEVEQPG